MKIFAQKYYRAKQDVLELRICYLREYLISKQLTKELYLSGRGERLEENLNTINPSSYIDGNFYRDIEYIFDYNNPEYNELIQGILFTVVRGSENSPRQNTVDGWLWKFNTNQAKQSSKKIVIGIRQSVNRI